MTQENSNKEVTTPMTTNIAKCHSDVVLIIETNTVTSCKANRNLASSKPTTQMWTSVNTTGVKANKEESNTVY